MLFEKVVTTTPLISYSDVTQIAAIGGGIDFFRYRCNDCR